MQALLREMAFFLLDTGKVQRIRNRLDIPLLMVLWIMATPDSFRSVALRFGVRPGSVHDNYSFIIEALRDMSPRYIQWPDREERALIKERFQRYSGFPGIVGALDGTYQNVTAPRVHPQSYINRHHQYSLNTMVVADDNLLIRYLKVGEVGSMHDSRVFRRSPLYMELLRNENDYLSDDEHIVGDGAYAVTNFLMTPYRNLGRLTEQQTQFNRQLSRCRVRIEHTFGKAFGQWRRMLESSNIDLAVDHFTASYVLHNFMILNGEEIMNLDQPDQFPQRLLEQNDDADEEEDVEEPVQNAEFIRLVNRAKRLGVEKRRIITENM
ncbi:Putative nuclease [Frankliniella fusca]|uniref:Nuclease n=1 Tax=Frankliniella fusca TaxID=407009 RepID=A0AAE1LG81_9NEOP|nr:Putative nuclease [Frankliniella fusca]